MSPTTPQTTREHTQITDQEAIRQYKRALRTVKETSNRKPAKTLWREHPALWGIFTALAMKNKIEFLLEWRERPACYDGGRPV